jgi:outer membrane lipoprotein-sorting protein
MPLNAQGWAMVLLLLAVSAPAEDAAIGDPALLERVVEAQAVHTTVQGQLVWSTRRIDEPGTPPREQRVRFYLAFPDRYCVIVTRPDDEEYRQSFISDGSRRWEVTQLFKGERPDRKSTPVGQDDELERRLLACFRLDLPTLRRDFTVVATPAAGGGADVRLTPVDPKLAEQLTGLVLAFDADLKLTRITSDDPQGNRMEFRVVEAIYDQAIDDALFRVAP